jgi:hypothetical protein
MFEELERARRALIGELESFGSFLTGVRAVEDGETPLTALLDEDGRTRRESLSNALQAFSVQLARSRSLAVRHLVDREGWTFTQVARSIGRTRQLVARLYKDGASEEN